jgi:RNA polymerase sigma factor (sigma-70 family)
VARRDADDGARPPRTRGPDTGWSDERLVRACLDGSDQAWSVLIDKYKALIYSIPRRYGASPEDAADIFQSVCLEWFSELHRLRNTAALRSWLITVTAHQAFHWKRRQRTQAERDAVGIDADTLYAVAPLRPDEIEQLEQEQMLRDAVAELPPRCREMIGLLFFTEPPLPYRDVARRLGLAVGSIGFIRGRCLQRLQKALQRMGF